MIKHPKYDRGNIYLSGGMQFKKGLGAKWRKTCSEKLMAMGYFPLDICELDRAYAEANKELFYRFSKDFTRDELLRFKSNIRKHFIFTDLELVRKDSDAIIVLWDEGAQLGGGTHNEISDAYEHDIPIFLVTQVPLEKIPGWVVSQTTKIFTRWEQLYTYLENLPHRILRRDVYGNHHSGEHYLCSLCGDPFKKEKHHFVSTISPLYCKEYVVAVTETYEDIVDRYQFFIEYLENEAFQETSSEENR